MNSMRYVPTEEQAKNSPTCAALAAYEVTEREVIEYLFRENERLHAHVAHLAAFQPIGPILSGGKVYTNPTADALAAEGHARAMAKMLDGERRAAVEAEREACKGIAAEVLRESDGGSVAAHTAERILTAIRERGAR